MRTQVYIADDAFQIILTAENKFEEDLLKHARDNSLSAKISHGEFVKCIDDNYRIFDEPEGIGRFYPNATRGKNNLIIRLTPKD